MPMLDDITLKELFDAITRATPLVWGRQLRDYGEEIECHVQSCAWVPDGLSLAGRPNTLAGLRAISDYPQFSIHRVLADLPASDGIAAMRSMADWLDDIAREVDRRRRVVMEQVAPLKADFANRGADPWYITAFDAYASSVTLGDHKLTLSAHRPTGAREDMHTLFVRPLLKRAPKRRFRLTLASADRGSHMIRVQIGRQRHVTALELPHRRR